MMKSLTLITGDLMRLFILMLGLFLPIASYALSCPNNGTLLNIQDPFEKVIQKCGQATASNNYEINTIVSAEWEYYITNSVSKTNTKLIILFDHDQVVNISILVSGENEQNIQSSNICGRQIQIGNHTNYVQSVCGTPTSQKTLKSTSIQVTELKYEGVSPNTLVFKNGSLMDWK